jgi:Family of unknown function (DUF6052)
VPRDGPRSQLPREPRDRGNDDLPDQDITIEQQQTLLRVYDDLRSMADHPTPVVRAGARLALAEIAHVVNALGLRYDLYTKDLVHDGGER